MFDRIRPYSRPWTLLAAVALVAFNAGCTSPSAPSGAVVPVTAASGAAVPLPGVHAPELSSGWTDKSGWTSQHFMIAAANPLATQAGYDMLKAGGTAIDAAIATQMVLALVEP
ncbi:gamma-glutamyltransferase, partial [Burkholderia cenocepacia]|nr:gamma-glutamyltransferase [Burkholderia cenocepacia]